MKCPAHRSRLYREALLYLALSAGLTLLLAGFLGAREPIDWFAVFFVNVLISIGIGGGLTVCYAALARVGLTTGRDFRPLAIVGHTIAISASIAFGAFVALTVAGFVWPRAAAWFPFRDVVQVALPVTVTIVFVTTVLDRWRQRTADAEQARLESELAAIHARINPHFLFNSLNTIAALIPEDAARAEDAVLELSSLLRHTLDGAQQRFVPLGREIAATRSYLAFEGLRFGDKLVVTFEVDDGVEDVRVPPLVLQPLAENAVKHGIARRGGGRVAITVHARDALTLTIEDDGDGTTDAEGTKTAHRDLAKRLDILYGDAARFTVDREGALGGFRVTLEVPREAPE